MFPFALFLFYTLEPSFFASALFFCTSTLSFFAVALFFCAPAPSFFTSALYFFCAPAPSFFTSALYCEVFVQVLFQFKLCRIVLFALFLSCAPAFELLHVGVLPLVGERALLRSIWESTPSQDIMGSASMHCSQ